MSTGPAAERDVEWLRDILEAIEKIEARVVGGNAAFIRQVITAFVRAKADGSAFGTVTGYPYYRTVSKTYLPFCDGGQPLSLIVPEGTVVYRNRRC